LNGECDRGPLGAALLLVRGGSADRSVEGDVGGGFAGRTGGDVAAALTVGAGLGAASALLAGQPVDGTFQAAGDEGLTDFDPVAAFPPMCLERISQRAFNRPGLSQLLAVGFPLLS